MQQSVTGCKRLAILEKYRGDVRLRAKGLAGIRQNVDIAAGQDESLRGKPNRRRHQGGARQGAELLARRFQTHDGAGHTNRQVSGQASVADDIAMRIKVHIGAGSLGRFLAKIEKGVSAVGKMNRHEPAAAEIAAARMRHRKRVADRNRRIDGIAALAQNLCAHLGGRVLGGHDHAVA